MLSQYLLGIGRRLLFGFTTIVMVTAGLARPANVRAAAEACGPISNGIAAGFAIDGKVLCSGTAIDWYKLPASSCLSVLDSPPGVCGNPIAGLGNTLFAQDSVGPSTGNDPTVFSGMSNTNQDLIGAGQSPWHWGAGTVPQKDDLTEAYINVRPAAADPNGDVWLVVGAAYRSTNGDKHFDFEFNQKGLTLNANGTITGNGTDGGRTSGLSGDIVLSIDYQQGGAAPCVHLRQWRAVGSSFAFVQVNAQCPSLPGAPPRDTAFSAVSGDNTQVPCLVFANSSGESRTNHYDALQFAEAAVNLSCYLPGFNLGSFCNTISTVQVKTRSSGSSGFGGAQLKDFLIAPFSLSTPPVANAGPDQSQCTAASGPNSFNLSGSCLTGNCGWSQVSGPTVTFGDAGSCATTASFTGPGTAVLRLTCSSQGCSATDDISLVANANPVASATHTDVKCFNGSDGSIDVTVTGGKTPYTFKWADGPTTEDRSGLAAGSYSVTVTDANGCTATTGATIGQPTQLMASQTHIDVKCNGNSTGSIDVTVTGGTTPYSFKWGDGPTTEDRSGLAAGSYSVTVTDAHGCTATTGATINQPTLLQASETSVDVKCFGNSTGSIDVTVTGGTTPYSFKWADGPTTEDRSGLAAGGYSVTVTDANGCTATTGATINQPTLLQASETSVDVKCFNGSDGSIDVTATGGTTPYSFKWADGPTTEDRTGLSAGSYSVTVTDANGCTATTGATIGQPPQLQASATHTDVKCNGGNDGAIDVTVTGGTTPYSFKWADGPTTEDRSGLTAGSYSVTITDANGCTTTSGATINEATTLQASATHGDVKCFNGSDGSIDVTVTGGTTPYSFKWADGPTTEDRSGLAAGSYSVTVTDANGCKATTGATINQPTLLQASATHVDVKCFNGSDGSIDVTASGGTPPYSFKWADGPTSEDRSGLPIGSYSVTVTDANGCTATTGATIGQPNLLVASQTHVDVLCHGASTGSIDVTVTGGTTPYSYKWGDGPTSEDRSGLAAGSYSVTVTDAHGCTATTGATITQPDLLTASATHVDVKCHGGSDGSIDVSETGGTPPYSFKWGDGPTTEDRSGLAAGSYSVTVTDAHGCTATTGATIGQPDQLVATSTKTDVTCQGALGSIDVTVTGGTTPYAFKWGDGPTTEDRSGLGAGSYSVTVTDANGCTASTGQTITSPSCGKIAPTQTTCSDFINGTAGDITGLCFGLKSGKINNVAPGVFFYFTKVTSQVSGSFTVNITQTATPAFAFFGVVQGNQVTVYDGACNTYANATLNSVANGQVSVTINGASIGQVFIVQVKYDANSIKGQSASKNTSIHYDFATFIGGSQVDADPDGLNLTNCVGGATVASSEEIGIGFYRPTPNPFFDATRMAYAVGEAGGHVDVGVYDLAGRRVRGLVNTFQTAGRYEVSWDGREDDGTHAHMGVYFIHAQVADQQRTIRVVYLK